MFSETLTESDIIVLSKLSMIPPGQSFTAKNIKVTRLANFLFDIRVELPEEKARNAARILLDNI